MADERTYIRVHDGIEDHPKVAAMSDKAFRLLITTWGWCSRHRTDGRVPLAVWKKRGTKGARDELERIGLAVLENKTVVMHDYLEHQRSSELIAEKVESKKRGGRLGNHRRWHAERGIFDSTCEFCAEGLPPDAPDPGPQKPSVSDRSTDRYRESLHRSRSDRKTSPETETETEKDLGDRSSPLPVGDARPRGRGASGPHATTAAKLVRRVLGRHITSATLTALTIEVAALLPEATEPELEAALERWNSRTGIGPRMLPGLVDDLRKEARGATTRASPTVPGQSATDAHFAARLARYTDHDGDGRPPLLAITGGAS